MASILLMSHDGAGCAIAYQCRLQGHDVKVWIEKEASRHLYDGLLTKVKRYEEGLRKGVVVLFDTVAIGTPQAKLPTTPQDWERYSNLADHLRKDGYAVIGGSGVADRLEMDRTWGAELAKKAGLMVPESKRFDDLAKTYAYVKTHPKRYVVKPHSNLETYSVYIGKRDDGDDMLDHLQYLIDHPKKDLTAVELQQYIDGIQMSIEVWKTKDRFTGYNSTFEEKPLYFHGIGPLTGEVGSTIFYYPSGLKTKVRKDVTDKLEPILRDLKLGDGPIDFNLIHDEHGSWFLEYSPRFGYPASYLQLFATDDNWGEVFAAIAAGTFTDFHPKPFRWFVGNRVWLPWWPSGKTDENWIDYPIFSQVRKPHLPHLAFIDAYFKDGRLRSGGTDGELMTVTDGGDSLGEAKEKVHRLLEEIRIYPMGWNPWVGSGIDLHDLKRFGHWLPATQ